MKKTLKMVIYCQLFTLWLLVIPKIFSLTDYNSESSSLDTKPRIYLTTGNLNTMLWTHQDEFMEWKWTSRTSRKRNQYPTLLCESWRCICKICKSMALIWGKANLCAMLAWLSLSSQSVNLLLKGRRHIWKTFELIVRWNLSTFPT